MNLDTLASLPGFYLPTLNYGGDWLAFYDEKLDFNLVNVQNGERRALTIGGAVPDAPLPFTWSRDDRFLYFSRSEGGTENYDVFRVDVSTGAVQPIWQHPEHAAYVLDAFGDDVLIGSTHTGIFNLARIAATPPPTDENDASEETAATDTHSNLHSLSQFPYPVHDAIYSSNGKYILVAANHTDSPRNVDLWVMRNNGARLERLLSNGENCQDGFSDWRGRLIAVHSDASGVRQCGVLDFRLQTLRWLSPRDGHYWPGRLSPNDTLLLAYLNQDASITPTLFNTRSGEQIKLNLPEGVYHGGQWIDDNAFIMSMETDVNRPQVIAYDLSTRQHRVVLAAEYGDLDRSQFTHHEYIRYPSADGTQIPAMLYRPQTPASGPRPAVVYLHGGPTAQFFRNFDIIAQTLASAGFVVLMPNVRGSTGYSAEFRDAIVLDWGGDDLQDVVAAGQYLAGLDDVDAGRIGVFGGSYGGLLVNLALTKHPDTFAAGLSFNGITDLERLDTDTDPRFRMLLRRYMGDPAQHAMLWRDRSPVHFAPYLQAPLLMLHGENDPRVPVSQVQVMREALLAAGKREGTDFAVQILDAEGHNKADVSGTARTLHILRDWFTARLG